MMKTFLLKILGYVFVLLGIGAPVGAGYLYLTRPEVVKAYIDSRADFRALDETERKQRDADLRAAVEGYELALRKAAQSRGAREIADIFNESSNAREREGKEETP